MAVYSRNLTTDYMKTCSGCANFECQNFFGVGKCTKEGMLAYFEDEACEDFVELPDDGIFTNFNKIQL
jgi:hypothetical protein